MDTYVVFVDLVKAFDSVPRDGLFEILKKFGIPPLLHSLIVDLHHDQTVKMKVGEKEAEMPSTAGVKQGDTSRPSSSSSPFRRASRRSRWSARPTAPSERSWTDS